MADTLVPVVPVPCMCSGIISAKGEGNETWEVTVYSSPKGGLSGPVYAKAIYSPGCDSYKVGDYVQVMIQFSFGGIDNKFKDVWPSGQCIIMGLFNERSIANVKVDNPNAPSDGDSVSLQNKKCGASVSIGKTGNITLSTNGSIYDSLSPMGNGSLKDSRTSMAQNHHRILSWCSPFYLSREHFGFYSGADDDDAAAKVNPEDSYSIYRRFVNQTRSPNNWVSTCEGIYAPWVGPNNTFNRIEKSKEVLLSKVVNYENSRITIECGEPGDKFINVRIDDVTVSETQISEFPGASPATVGNRFTMTVSDKGAVEVRAAGNGSPLAANQNKFLLKIDESGNLSIMASGKISLTHGDSDEAINSIVLDPSAGVDIVAKNGFRVNGSELVTKAFLDWLDQNKANLCQVTSVGGPAPISPTALPGMTSGIVGNMDSGGFLTQNVGQLASGTIMNNDDFSSV